MGRGERGGGETKRAADGARREGRRRSKECGRWGGAREAAAKERVRPMGRGERYKGQTPKCNRIYEKRYWIQQAPLWYFGLMTQNPLLGVEIPKIRK